MQLHPRFKTEQLQQTFKNRSLPWKSETIVEIIRKFQEGKNINKGFSCHFQKYG